MALGHLNGMPEASNSIKSVSSYQGVTFDLSLIAKDTEFYRSIKHISYHTGVTIDYISEDLIINAERLNYLILDELKTY